MDSPIDIEITPTIPPEVQQTTVLECTVANMLDRIAWCNSVIDEAKDLRANSMRHYEACVNELNRRKEVSIGEVN